MWWKKKGHCDRFPPCTSIPLPNLIPPTAPHSLIILSLTLSSLDTDSAVNKQRTVNSYWVSGFYSLSSVASSGWTNPIARGVSPLLRLDDGNVRFLKRCVLLRIIDTQRKPSTPSYWVTQSPCFSNLFCPCIQSFKEPIFFALSPYACYFNRSHYFCPGKTKPHRANTG
jgi:hypothetical protein